MNDLTWLCDHLDGLDLTEGAFAARALAQCQETELVSRYHARVAAGVPGSDWPTAAWLWAAGEDFALLTPDAQAAVLDAARRLLPTMASRRHAETVAYGAVYGALRVMEAHLPDLELARMCKEIRAYVIAEATYGGRLASVPGSHEAGPELLLLVPFGLFGPEDRLMFATVEALEQQGLPGGGTAAAWLAWYYKVKGTHPRRLAELREGLVEESVWAAAFRLLLSGQAAQALTIHHLPTGHDHPYHRYTPERLPRDPVAGDTVEVRATVDGEAPSLWVEWSVDGVGQGVILAAFQAPTGVEEGYWSAVLGPLEGGARVRYRFACAASQTAWFDFAVLRRNSIRAVTAVAQGPGGELELTCATVSGGSPAVITLAPEASGALRLRFRPSAAGDPVTAPGAAAAAASPGTPAPTEWQVGPYRVRVAATPPCLTVCDQAGTPVLTEYPGGAWQWLEDPDGAPVRVECAFTAAQEERFYGTGERYDRLDRRGTTVLNTVYNQYKQQGDRTYIPVPFLLSSRGYGLWADTSHVGEIDVADSRPDRLRLAFAGIGLDLCLLPGPRPVDVLQGFAAQTGLPVLPPVWAFGPWMSSNNWDTQAEVERQAQRTQALDIPSTVLVVEQWSDEATFYLFNDAKYTPRPSSEALRYQDFTFPEWGRWQDPKGMVQRLHDQGLKVLLWQIPVWKYMNGVRHTQRDLDETFLIEQGYVVRNPDGSPYRIPEGWFAGSLLIDFTNPAATHWWLEKRRYLMDEVGLDGFKTDGGEFIWGREAVFADGSTGAVGRNLYANQFIEATYRFVHERSGGNGITFSRAGYTGAQAFPLHWAGDEDSTWPALRASLIAGLNAGLSGISMWGWDLGGFSGDIPGAELFCRAAAMACFCPVMQYHAESKAQLNQDRTPWNIADRTGRPDVIETYRFFAHLRMNLLPYIYSQAVQSCETGLPMMRPLCLMHPEDPACADITDQYYFGTDLLVAPVVEEGATARTLYLPAGLWYDFWTGGPVRGPLRLTCEVPQDRIPVFVRAGAAVALNLADSGLLGEGMRNQDVDSLRHLHLYVYHDEGEFKAEHRLPTQETLTVQARCSSGLPSVATAGVSRGVHVRSFVPD